MFEIELTTRAILAPDLPRHLYIEVTNHCNSFCVSCPLTYDHFLPLEPKQHLSWENFRRIVDPLPHLDRVVLHGIGEPLLNRELPRFIAHLKARGAYVLFNSNGILLDQKRGDALVAAGLDELRVSLDAVTPSLYAKLRGIDALPKIIKNLQAFVERHGKLSNPKLSLWLVGLQENLHELLDFVKLGATIGVSAVYLQRLVYFGDGQRLDEGSTMTIEQSLYGRMGAQQEQLISQAEALATQLGLIFQASGATTPHESISVKGEHPWQGCMRPWLLMYVTANGNTLPCCIAPFAAPDYTNILLGNIFETPLTDVWNGERYQALRAAVLSETPSPWPCQHCGVKWSL